MYLIESSDFKCTHATITLSQCISYPKYLSYICKTFHLHFSAKVWKIRLVCEKKKTHEMPIDKFL